MKYLATLLITCLALFNTAYAADTKTSSATVTTPTETIKYATDAIIKELQAIPKEERNYKEVQRLIENYILPAIDQERIAKMALGKHWRKATKAQRIAFIDTFRDLQIRTYTGAFEAFDGQKFIFGDARFNKSGSRAIVKGEMVQPSGQRIPIDFKMFINKQKEWKIYDAVIAGLGMVTTYRQQLTDQLQRETLDEVIAGMEKEIKTAQR
jgi:ABC-type transporter MlaC component